MEHNHEHDPVTQRAFDHIQQSNQAARHAIASMIRELPEDHLTSLATLLGAISQIGGKSMAAYYHGQAIVSLETRFNICSACGVNHDKQLADMVTPAAEKINPADVADVKRLTDDVGKVIERTLHAEDFPEPGGTPDLMVGERGPLSARQLLNMSRYNLEDMREGAAGLESGDPAFAELKPEDFPLVGFACKNCGRHWQTIEDRMLTPPGVKGCDGCQHKAKWG